MLLDAVCTSKDDLILLFEEVFGRNQVIDDQAAMSANRNSIMSYHT